MAKSKPAQPRWRFTSLLTYLGSTAAIQSGIASKGYTPPPKHTIDGWRQRNSIPTRWLPLIIELAVEGGFIRDAKDLRQ